MNKTLMMIVGLAVLVILGIWLFGSSASAPTNDTASQPTDSTASINQSLDSVDVGDLDKEFQDVDASLNSL